LERYICIHGHFYQPPRENPWLEEIELQDSAYPYHDWNERITAQCYAPNGASRILDSEQRIVDIVNNYSKISFNFGPTLLAWLERNQPETYEAILDADRLSLERFGGHGSALAQGYNHMIMPLANKRDKVTQVVWGMEDFRNRFGRDPEGMWLPETAVDIETLEVLASMGIKFTILAPRQGKRVRKIVRRSHWKEVRHGRIDPSMAYCCPLPSGRMVNLFFYDGPIAQDIAFGDLIRSSESLVRRLADAFNHEREWAQLVHVAVDGESFGHHTRHGDRTLAYCLYLIENGDLARLSNYGEYLANHPPTHYVEIIENSSWSCIHGVERWRENCGCQSGGYPEWTQAWRKPLRDAMDWLRDKAGQVYEERASLLFKSPWEARNDYIRVIGDRSLDNLDAFLQKHGREDLGETDHQHWLCLLEMERHALLMYTSCGWFFDEVSGIETVQVLQYAGRVIQFIQQFNGESVEEEFLARLEVAPSNIHGNARRAFELFVKPAQLDLLRVGIHYAVSSLFEDYADESVLFCYAVNREVFREVSAGRMKLVIGKVRVVSRITRQAMTLSFAVLHLGDHNISGGVREYQGEGPFSEMEGEITSAFERGDVPEVVRLTDRHFGMNNFSIWHLFRDEQRKVIDQVLDLAYREAESSYRRIYRNSQTVMNFLLNLSIPLPKAFTVAAEQVIQSDLRQIWDSEVVDPTLLERLIEESNRWNLSPDREMLSFRASSWIAGAFQKIQSNPEDPVLLGQIERILQILSTLNLDLDLWKSQNIYFSLGRSVYAEVKARALEGDPWASEWVGYFERMGPFLKVKGI
jgi:alpha-amylase/alpha-mannosidase (GH57 family)